MVAAMLLPLDRATTATRITTASIAPTPQTHLGTAARGELCRASELRTSFATLKGYERVAAGIGLPARKPPLENGSREPFPDTYR